MKNNVPLNPDVALDIILNNTQLLDSELVPLKDTLSRVLAEDICSAGDLPPFDNSAMDGYAVISADTKGASKESPVILNVLAEAPAGKVVDAEVVHGTAVQIMTGAPIPQGADSVVMVEDTAKCDYNVSVYREARLGANIRPAGEDVKNGELVMQAGRRIRSMEMGMLAALGKTDVAVYRRPRVAIITSGNELVDVNITPGPGQIRNSNRYSLYAQVLSAGAEVSMSAQVVDERDELENVLSSAAEISDLIMVSGGVSVGDYDFVKETLAKLGEILFWRVFIKPGKPLTYGKINGIPMFGLPGNPVSSMVTFDMFVRPSIYRMMGLATESNTSVSGVITQNIRHNPCIREFVRAVTVWENGVYSSTPTGKQGSGRLSTMLNANSYIVIPEGIADLAEGDCVNIILFE